MGLIRGNFRLASGFRMHWRVNLFVLFNASEELRRVLIMKRRAFMCIWVNLKFIGEVHASTAAQRGLRAMGE